MVRTLVLCLALLSFAFVTPSPTLAQGGDEPAKPARSAQQAQKDADAIRAMYDKHDEAFAGIEGGVSVHETSIEGTLRRCEDHVVRIEAIEKEAVPEIRPLLAGVLDLWGKPDLEQEVEGPQDPALVYAMEQSAEIEWNMKQAGAQDLDWVATRFVDLTRMLINVRKTRAANAEYLVNHVKGAYSDIGFFVEDIRVDKLKEAKTLLEWALKFDGTNEDANARMATIDAEIAALQKQLEAEIDARTWAGNVADFGGPGTAAGLAEASLDYLRNDRDWGKSENGTEVLAVCVRSGWEPADRDVFGRIISWRLPVHVAATRPALKAKGVARVYELSMVAKEGPPGNAPKAPPFDGFWVGDSWDIRLSKLPQ